MEVPGLGLMEKGSVVQSKEVAQFFDGLKSRSDEVRLKAARSLQKYVSTEMRELPTERFSSTLDLINTKVHGLVSSPELHEKKGGVLAIGKLIALLQQGK